MWPQCNLKVCLKLMQDLSSEYLSKQMCEYIDVYIDVSSVVFLLMNAMALHFVCPAVFAGTLLYLPRKINQDFERAFSKFILYGKKPRQRLHYLQIWVAFLCRI